MKNVCRTFLFFMIFSLPCIASKAPNDLMKTGKIYKGVELAFNDLVSEIIENLLNPQLPTQLSVEESLRKNQLNSHYRNNELKNAIMGLPLDGKISGEMDANIWTKKIDEHTKSRTNDPVANSLRNIQFLYENMAAHINVSDIILYRYMKALQTNDRIIGLESPPLLEQQPSITSNYNRNELKVFSNNDRALALIRDFLGFKAAGVIHPTKEQATKYYQYLQTLEGKISPWPSAKDFSQIFLETKYKDKIDHINKTLMRSKKILKNSDELYSFQVKFIVRSLNLISALMTYDESLQITSDPYGNKMGDYVIDFLKIAVDLKSEEVVDDAIKMFSNIMYSYKRIEVIQNISAYTYRCFRENSLWMSYTEADSAEIELSPYSARLFREISIVVNYSYVDTTLRNNLENILINYLKNIGETFQSVRGDNDNLNFGMLKLIGELSLDADMKSDFYLMFSHVRKAYENGRTAPIAVIAQLYARPIFFKSNKNFRQNLLNYLLPRLAEGVDPVEVVNTIESKLLPYRNYFTYILNGKATQEYKELEIKYRSNLTVWERPLFQAIIEGEMKKYMNGMAGRLVRLGTDSLRRRGFLVRDKMKLCQKLLKKPLLK